LHLARVVGVKTLNEHCGNVARAFERSYRQNCLWKHICSTKSKTKQLQQFQLLFCSVEVSD